MVQVENKKKYCKLIQISAENVNAMRPIHTVPCE